MSTQLTSEQLKRIKSYALASQNTRRTISSSQGAVNELAAAIHSNNMVVEIANSTGFNSEQLQILLDYLLDENEELQTLSDRIQCARGLLVGLDMNFATADEFIKHIDSIT